MSLLTLPDDALLPILQLLDPIDAFELEQSSRRFADFVQEQLPKLRRPAELTIVLPGLGLELELVDTGHEEIIQWSLERRQGLVHRSKSPLVVPVGFPYKKVVEKIIFYFPTKKSVFIRGVSASNLEFILNFIQHYGPFLEIAFTELRSQPALPLTEDEFFKLMSILPENSFRMLSLAIPVEVGLGIFQLPQLRHAVLQIYPNTTVAIDDELLQLMPPIYSLIIYTAFSRSQISEANGYLRFFDELRTGRREAPHLWVFHLPAEDPNARLLRFMQLHLFYDSKAWGVYLPPFECEHARLIIMGNNEEDWPQIKSHGPNLFRKV